MMRFVDVAGQVAANLGDRVLDVVDGAIGIDLQPELDVGRRLTVGDRREDVFDARQIGDGILDALRHLRLELGGRRAGLRDGHLHHRHVDVGKARHRQLGEAHQAEHAQDREQQDRGDRLADRERGEVDVHCAIPFFRGLVLVGAVLGGLEDADDTVAVAQERAGARDDLFAVLQAGGDLDETIADEAEPDEARAHLPLMQDLHAGADLAEGDGRLRHADACPLSQLDDATGEGADRASSCWRARQRGCGQAVSSCRLRGETSRTAPVSVSVNPAGCHQHGLASADARQTDVGDLGFQFDFAFGDDAKQGLANGAGDGTELGGPAADEAGLRRLDFGARDPHLDLAALGIETGDIELRRRHGTLRRCAFGFPGLLEGHVLLVVGGGRVAALLELARPVQGAAGFRQIGLDFGDLGIGLGDGRFGARALGGVLGELRFQRGALQASENLPLGDAIAFLDEDFRDGEAFDFGGDHDLFARHERARDDGAFGDLAPSCRNDADDGQLTSRGVISG